MMLHFCNSRLDLFFTILVSFLLLFILNGFWPPGTHLRRQWHHEACVNGLNTFGIEASALPNLAVMGAKPPGISSLLDPASCTH